MTTTTPYRITPEIKAAHARALAADRRLQALDRVVNALCELVRPEDEFCYGCTWKRLVKPLATPLVGYGRGYQPQPASDPNPDGPRIRSFTATELESIADRPRVAATTDTEKWLRTSEAWDGVTRVWLARLWDADPGNGCGISRGERDAAMDKRTAAGIMRKLNKTPYRWVTGGVLRQSLAGDLRARMPAILEALALVGVIETKEIVYRGQPGRQYRTALLGLS